MHACPNSAPICAGQTGWVHVPPSVMAFLLLLLALYLLRFTRMSA